MRIELTVRDRHGLCHDVAVTAPAGVAVGDVDEQLCAVIGAQAPVVWSSGSLRLMASAPLGGPGLRTGDIISVNGPEPRDPSAGAVLRLQVVGGPDSGQVVALPRGMTTVGRSGDCDLVLTDPDVSQHHAYLTVTAGGITVRDLNSTNGTSVAGVAVDDDGTVLAPDVDVRVGDSFLSVSPGADPAAAVRATPGGSLLVNRPPRVREPLRTREIVFPTPGVDRPAQRLQLAAALLPAAVGVVLAVVMHSVQFLAFALLSPVVVLATAVGDRLHWRRIGRHEARSRRRSEAIARAEVVAGLAHEVSLRRRADPDPVALHSIATTPGTRLWERGRADADLLSVRLGLGDLPGSLRARRGASVESAGRLRDVPVHVDLRTGPLGIAAPIAVGLGLARWLVCQLAVLHSPADLHIALLLSPGADARWEWSRWLPHLGGRVAATQDERQALVADLGYLVEQRLSARRPDAAWAGPWLVLVVDRAGDLSDQPGLPALLSAGPAVGVAAICLDEHDRHLPVSCTTTAIATGETGTRLRITAVDGLRPVEVVADRVRPEWAEDVARALAPLVDPGSDAGALPRRCRLVDLLGVADFDVAQLLGRWARSDRDSAGTILGVGVDGPVTVDLVRDGPHVLVAGTTGSGKSELLQTLIAGLAVSYPPEVISFVLIDYKGGAAFAECAGLPHVVGLVTDLDTQLTERALRSLRHELSHREERFSQVGAKDLAAYRAAVPPGTSPARLVLVVDEFAALADELPEFVSGLVAIAQRGRSLGVHLVLATQRPGGVVSPEIRANTSLRVALRMSDPAESADVIDTDRAAYLARDAPGRALIRVGAALTEIQTAQVGGQTPPRASSDVIVTPLAGWRRGPSRADPSTDGDTDLQLLMRALTRAASAAGRPSPRRPWLPPLPALLPADSLAPAARNSAVRFGLLDRPDAQLQSPVELDLDAGGSVLFTGRSRSGRSGALVTIAGLAAGQLGPDELAIYAIDCAGGALAIVAELPHCATAASRDHFDVVATLLRRLEAEVVRRQAWLAELGINSVADARTEGHPVSLMLCLVDGWEGFVSAAEEYDAARSVEVLTRMLRATPAAGLTVILTGDRATLSARLASAAATKFVFALTDRADFALAGIPARAIPGDMPPGRAIRAVDAAEVQVAFIGSAPSRVAQARHIASTGVGAHHRARAIASGFEPIRIRPLPTRVALSALSATPGRFTIGAGGDAADALCVDLFAGGGRLLVAGPHRSGRSTVLRLLLVQAVRDGVPVVVAAPQRSPVVAAAVACGIAVLAPDSPDGDKALQPHRRILLLVDDSDAFLDTAAGEALSTAVRAAPAGLAAVVAGNSDDLPLTYRGVAAEVRRSRCALVLQPGPGDGELVGRRLHQRRAPIMPGRGVLVGDSAWGERFAAEPVPIQVAVP